MKKIISIIVAAIMMAGCFCACTLDGGQSKKNDNIKIVASIFPEYDWVMNVLGDNPGNAEVTLLLDNGVDLHSYQPTAEDIVTISNCDLFIYVGGESDEWIEELIANSDNKDMVAINLMEVLGDKAKEEELVEGMQEEEHDHDHDHEDGEEHDHEEGEEHDHEHEEEEVEYDEHVWLSLRNASIFTDKISEELQSIDKANADVYKSNAEAYIDKLNNLDKEYEDAVASAQYKTVLFGDRFPFRYMVDDYGITYYAAFVGCSTENQANFDTILFLSEKMDELSLPCIMTIDSSDQKIAKTIVENTKNKDQKILTIDSMQTTTMKDVNEGKNYLSVMEDNLEVLKEALVVK
jgi:zinc transport system substrate-binding protein